MITNSRQAPPQQASTAYCIERFGFCVLEKMYLINNQCVLVSDDVTPFPSERCVLLVRSTFDCSALKFIRNYQYALVYKIDHCRRHIYKSIYPNRPTARYIHAAPFYFRKSPPYESALVFESIKTSYHPSITVMSISYPK
jgi:hypothetical protein